MGRCPLAIPLAVLIAIILIGDSLGLRRPQEPPILGDAECSANVLSIRETSTIGRMAIVEIDSMNGVPVSPFMARIHLLSEEPYISGGRSVGFRADISLLKPPPDIPDVVDLQASLRRQGVTASAVLVSDSIRYVADGKGIMAAMRRANDDVRARLHESPLSDLSIEMLSAMLLGRGEYLTDDSRSLFSAAGLSHLLALSGMHVGVIAMIVSVMLWPLYFSRHKKSRLLLTALALWGYAAFTGFMPSVTRSVIMATVYILARVLQRRSVPMNSLCLAALLILLISPSELFDIGFQLSFAAVAGIIAFFPLINRVNRREHPRVYMAVSWPSVSLSAMILSGFVAAFHFHAFPVAFIVSNLLVAPLIPLFICSGILSMVFSIAGPTDLLASAIESVARTTASLPGAVIDGIYPSGYFVIIVIAILLILAWSLHARRRFWAWESGILLAGVFVVAACTPRKSYPRDETFVVVENGHKVRLIERRGDECLLLTNSRLEAERRDDQQLYSLLLRDYMALRGIDSLRLMPRDSTAFSVIGGDTLRLALDSCDSRRIAYYRKE